jgi:DNA invertase Pin-like site-specific DNA recombinase
MSTDMQEYSLDNQADAIEQYAHQQGFAVVRTYEDAGRSGLLLKHRPGLQRLLADVVDGNVNYAAVLVYDVSRWGRFQDVDEGAYYEFLCRKAGIPVHYCTEPFTNDGTMSSSIIKALKRSMAAEFSRELGMKSYAGKKRLAEMGFRVGGQAGYGMHRVMLSANGKRKQILNPGEYKNLTTDRVILTPGVNSQVERIRQIYQMALRKRFSEVLQELKDRHVPFVDGKPWTYDRVYKIATNPKYAGCNVWGRTTTKLRSKQKRTEASQWVVKPGAFRAVVGQEIFDRVQAAHKRRSRGRSDTTLIRKLQLLLKKKGKLTVDLVRDTRGMPSKSTYVAHFGSMMRAYELAGYHPSDRQRRVHEHLMRMKNLRGAILGRIESAFPMEVQRCRLRNRRPALLVDHELVVSVLVARCYKTTTFRKVRWEVLPHKLEKGLVSLLCLADPNFDSVRSFYVMPGINLGAEYQIKGTTDPWLRRGRRLGTIQDFYTVVRETASHLEQCSIEAPEVAPSARRQRKRSSRSRSIYPPDGVPRIGAPVTAVQAILAVPPERDRHRHRKDFGL